MEKQTSACCKRCGKSVDPANFGYNPQDVKPGQAFYCQACGPVVEAEEQAAPGDFQALSTYAVLRRR